MQNLHLIVRDEDGNKKVNQHLYKISRQGDRIFAYPINKLEENESAEFSTTKANNKFAPRAFYEPYISRINDIESERIKFLTPEELNDMALTIVLIFILKKQLIDLLLILINQVNMKKVELEML